MPPVFHWFRRDLRINDNHALFEAIQTQRPLIGIFIFDSIILDDLEDKNDARVSFIHQELIKLKSIFQSKGGDLIVRCGKPEEIWPDLCQRFESYDVYANEDYEPYALQRDDRINTFLQVHGGKLHTYTDHIVFHPKEILKPDGTPYTVFTPFSKKWKERLLQKVVPTYNSENINIVFPVQPEPLFALEYIGFERSSLPIPPLFCETDIYIHYKENRDFPAQNGTSRLGIHYRFGTLSIRKKVQEILPLSEVYLNELIWREFYIHILFHFPDVVLNAFKSKYDQIPWENKLEMIEKWTMGLTGYPLVDAGMRELKATGYMHNRVRMVTASFLTKHLLTDWRVGEAWFARHLLDFELASNNGGWQWAAGCGTDAAPYFRIFNPMLQQQRFDPQGIYIKKWIPELNTPHYPNPIIPHEYARQRCLDRFQSALKS